MIKTIDLIYIVLIFFYMNSIIGIPGTFAQTTESTPTGCMACLNNVSKKFWESSSTRGYWCNIGDTSSNCGGLLSSYCSNDDTRIPGNSERALCPEDEDTCGGQLRQFGYTGTISSVTFKTLSPIPTTSSCHYQTTNGMRDTNKNFKVSVKSIFNANLEVYIETSEHKYSYKESLSEDDSYVVNLDSSYHDIVYVLVPTGSAPASVEFKVAKYSAFPVWAIVLIVIAWVICLGGIILVVVIVLVIRAKNRASMSQGNRNAAATYQPRAVPTSGYQQNQMGLDPYSNQNAVYNLQMQQPNQVQDYRPGYYSEVAPTPQPIAQPVMGQPSMNQTGVGQPVYTHQPSYHQPGLMHQEKPRNTDE